MNTRISLLSWFSDVTLSRWVRNTPWFRLCLCTCLTIPTTSSAATATLYQAWPGDCVSAGVGAGDLDHDGYGDVLFGVATNCVGGASVNGSISAYSGLSGRLLLSVKGETPDFGTVIASVGDLDGDGVPDFVAGAPSLAVAGVSDCGAIYAYSGATGLLLYRRTGGPGDGSQGDELGASISPLSDLDNDGKPDLLVGAPGALNGLALPTGVALVLSGATGQELRRIEGEGSGFRFGASVGGLSDVDGDGVSDLLVTGPGYQTGLNQRFGATYVYSGASGTLVYRLLGSEDASQYGRGTAPMGDLDGDGRGDFAVSAPMAAAGVGFGGAAFVYSGSTGSLIRELDGPYFNLQMGSAIAAADVNGDGVEDLILGAPVAGVFGGSVFVISGADWSQLMEVDGRDDYDYLGGQVGNGGDVNGDHRDDVCIGASFLEGVRGPSFLYGLADVTDSRPFTSGGTNTVALGSGSDSVAVEVEPVNGSFSPNEVLPPSVWLRRASNPLKSVRPNRVAMGGDSDHNGVSEVACTFSRTDFRNLFGVQTVREDTATVIVSGDLQSGARLEGRVLLRLVSAPSLTVISSPNPIRSTGTLSFITTRPGMLKVRLFDSSGRLVRDLSNQMGPSAGYHDVFIDGRDQDRKLLASGIYFIQVESLEGVGIGRIVIIR